MRPRDFAQLVYGQKCILPANSSSPSLAALSPSPPCTYRTSAVGPLPTATAKPPPPPPPHTLQKKTGREDQSGRSVGRCTRRSARRREEERDSPTTPLKFAKRISAYIGAVASGKEKSNIGESYSFPRRRHPSDLRNHQREDGGGGGGGKAFLHRVHPPPPLSPLRGLERREEEKGGGGGRDCIFCKSSIEEGGERRRRRGEGEKGGRRRRRIGFSSGRRRRDPQSEVGGCTKRTDAAFVCKGGSAATEY